MDFARRHPRVGSPRARRFHPLPLVLVERIPSSAEFASPQLEDVAACFQPCEQIPTVFGTSFHARLVTRTTVAAEYVQSLALLVASHFPLQRGCVA